MLFDTIVNRTDYHINQSALKTITFARKIYGTSHSHSYDNRENGDMLGKLTKHVSKQKETKK